MKSITNVIVIGLDGLEPTIVESLLTAGELPNLARLEAQGGYARVRTTYPAQTPVAWSTFATGTNPGGHGVYDFITRDRKTYFPVLALNHYEQKNAFLPPQVKNGRRGIPFWELLSKAGISSSILRHPLTYPPDNIQGQMLGGVGVPDLRGGLGTYTLYTSAEGVKAEEGESVVLVHSDAKNNIATYVIGPHDPRAQADFKFDIQLSLQPAAKKVNVRSAGQPKELEVREGQWSNWLQVNFKVGPLMTVRGLVRFYLIQMQPELMLFASPVNFDPGAPLFPISSPPGYAKQLAAAIGTFHTAGMAEEDTGLKNRRLSEEAFLAQCELILREREKMMLYELERQRDGFFFLLFDTPDRLQHVFWRFREPNHPANRGDVTPKMAGVIEEHYRTLDSIVGRAMSFINERTLFIVLSDHGMNSFQRGLNVNTWLHDNGFLTLQNGVEPGEIAGDFLRCVDWSRTQAFAVGLGGIYLNLQGREDRGIVKPDEADRVCAAIVAGLTHLPDPERGAVAVRSVLTRNELYHGAYAAESPDLLINFAPGYRASWGTPLGGIPQGWLVDNDKKWGGDHCIDPSMVPGVLFMNRAFRGEHASLVDLAPTVLGALRVPKDPAMEGQSLLVE